MRDIRRFGRLALDTVRRQWVIDGVEPHISLRIKDVFRRVNKGSTSEFRFPADDLHAHELLWFVDRFPMRISDADMRALRKGRKDFLDGVGEVERILLPDFVPPAYQGLRDGCALWPYQAQAVEVFRRRKRFLLGDDVGLGKTNTAIGCMLDPSVLPAAVVVQAHLPDQWAERIEEFSSLKVHIVKTVEPYTLPPADVYIYSYSKLHKWSDVFATGFFRSVFLDEPQELRTGLGTNKGAAAKKLCDAASYVLGLTATPVMNYGIEMFRVMEFIASGALGSEDEFLREWCTGENMVKDPDALGSYLREQHLLIRRTEEDVGHQMPKPNVTQHEVVYDDDRAAESQELAVKLAIRATQGTFVQRGQAYRELDMLERMTTGVAKARGVAEYVRILLEADLPVLLAGWHREVYDIWNEELAEFNPVMYTGSEGKAAKRRAKEAFVSGKTRLKIISLRSGAGLDGLQHACRDLVIGELDWSPMIHKQLIGRLRRTGQLGQVNVHYMLAPGGSDPLMVETLGLKSSQSHGIMNPFTAPAAVENDESRMQRLAQLVLARRAQAAAA